MSDTETTEPTPSLESQLMASLDKADSGTKTAVVEAAAPDTKEEVKEESKDVTETVEANGDAEATTEPEKEAESTDASTDALDPDFVAAVEKHKPISLDDLPPEARPLVEKRLKEMQGAWTKAMQDARSYRKDEAGIKQDIEYRTKSPDLWLADFIQRNPDVIDKVNAELEKRTDPTYAEAQKMQREAAADRAQVDADRAERAQAARTERAEEVETYVTNSAKTKGIPVALVEDAIAVAILAKPENERDITEDEIDRIIEAKAKVYRQSVGAHKGAQTREYAKQKAADAKGGVVPPRTAVTTETVEQRKPKNLEEAMNMALDRLESVA